MTLFWDTFRLLDDLDHIPVSLINYICNPVFASIKEDRFEFFLVVNGLVKSGPHDSLEEAEDYMFSELVFDVGDKIEITCARIKS